MAFCAKGARASGEEANYYRSWKIIYQEQYVGRAEAVRRERFLKSGQGRKFLDYILK